MRIKIYSVAGCLRFEFLSIHPFNHQKAEVTMKSSNNQPATASLLRVSLFDSASPYPAPVSVNFFLTIYVPSGKIKATYAFNSRHEVDNFVRLNQIQLYII